MLKDDLRSHNEELEALNNRLQATIEQQRATSRDLQNLLDSTDVATLFLDADLNVRFFTPAARSLFSIITSDLGRPLADLLRRFEDDNLLTDARAVLMNHTPVRREVRAAKRRLVYSRDAALPQRRRRNQRGGDHVYRRF